MPDKFKIGEFWLSIPRNSKYWHITWFDGDSRQTRRRSLRTVNFEQAKEQLAEYAVAHRKLRKESPHSVSLGEILGRYYTNHGQHCKDSDAVKAAIKKVIEHSPGLTVSQYNLEHQEQFIADMREAGLADGTITKYQSVVRRALQYAYKRDQLESVPYIKTVGAGQNDRVMTLEESAALWNEVTSDHIGLWMMLAFNTLARPSAALELEWHQVDMENRLINLNQPGRKQTNKFRPVVPISDTLYRYLVPNESARVIGKELKSVKRQFGTMVKRAGLDNVTAYTIRHTMATELRKRGVPPWELSGFMGHKIAGTTEIYAQYDPSYMRTASQAIDAYFAELAPHLRSNCVAFTLPQRPIESRKPLIKLVGHAGFEPTTPSPPETGKRHNR